MVERDLYCAFEAGELAVSLFLHSDCRVGDDLGRRGVKLQAVRRRDCGGVFKHGGRELE